MEKKTIYSDKPIVNSTEDILNRKDFSNTIADYLLSPSSTDGLVVSINGKWGSGKTSVANLIKERIHERSFGSKDVIPVVVDYSPWNATDQNQIVCQFLNTLGEHFAYKYILKTLKKVLGITSSVLCFAPIIPSSIKQSVKDLDKAFSNYVYALSANNGNLEDIKNRVERYLKKSKLRYLVFIDDLDRLNKQEIKHLIQLVKSVCSFSNITYILLYDKDIVADALASEQSVDGYNYLEKIVQLEFNVPRVRSDTILEILGSDLDQLLEGKTDRITNKRIQDYLSLGLFRQISTVREEKRLISLLRFAIDIFYKEIYIPDLIAITYLRMIDENLYRLIVSEQDSVLGTRYYDKEENAEGDKDNFITSVKNTKFNYSESPYLLKHLFPYMFSRIPDKLGEDYLKGRLYIPNIFHKYVQMDYDYEDFSLDRVNNILRFDNPSYQLSIISKELNPAQGRQLLNVLSEYCKDLKDKKVFKQVLEFLFSNLSELAYSRPFMIVDKNYYVGSVCSSLINNIELKEAEELLVRVIRESNDVGALVCFCNYIDYSKEGGRFNFSSLDDKTKDDIISVSCKKALAVLDKDINAEYYDFASVISLVITHDKERLKNLVAVKDDNWLVSFFARSAFVGHSYSDDDYYYPYFQIDQIIKVANIDTNDIDRLFSVCSILKYKQRLIVLRMQLDGVQPKDKHYMGFSMVEIQDYCDKEGIAFKASDDYER